ncbi:MAG: fumarylacetoacetate hydrolase family protein [Pseudomonadota bacterium]
MRVMSFSVDGRQSYGVVSAAGVVDAGIRLSEHVDLRSVLAAEGLDLLRTLASEHTADYALEDVTFEPVIPAPDKIICVGINYKPHVLETGRDMPEHPVLFVRFPGSQVGHDEALVAPSLSHRFDFEGELAVIIGRAGRHIPAHGALRHVAGYSCFNDGSVRDYQRHSPQFTPGKNFSRSGSFGPWMVTADEIGDPATLSLETRLNNEVMQKAECSELIFDVPALIAYISSFAELLPGDVIVTGTPGGVGFARKPPIYMQPGDTVEVDISGIGVLRNSVTSEVETVTMRALQSP